jgi:lysophospholipase
VNGNSADAGNFPNGSELLTTYVQSFNHGYTRMPLVPSVETFISEGLNKRATFFGCNDQSKVTIVYLPNNNYTFASNTGTFQLEYPEWETDAMIANGVGIATQGEKGGWGTCLACALMMKTENTLPSDCTACLAEYCYYGS